MEPDLENLLKKLNSINNTNNYYEDDYYEDNYEKLELLASNKELIPQICEEYDLEPSDILELLHGNISPEECKNLGFDSYYIVQLIIYYENVNEYLTPEKCSELRLGDDYINMLLEESDSEVFQNYKGTGLTGVIKATGNIEKYLKPEQLSKLKLGSDTIISLLEETGNIEEYLTPEICKIGKLSNYQILNLIKKTNNIGQYMLSEKIKDFGLSDIAMSELINEYVNEDNFKIIYDLGYNHTILKSVDLIYKKLDEILELEGCQDKKMLIEKLYQKNIDFLKADFKILDDKFLKTLGEEKINQISCYYEYVDKVIQLDEDKLKIIEKCLTFYQEKNKTDEWGPLFARIIDNIDSYSDLIKDISTTKNIDNIEIDKIITIFSHDNFFNISTIEDLKHYEEIKREKCNKLLNSDYIDDKINAVSILIYGQSTQELEELFTKYGECIDDIKDDDLKYYIKSIEILLKIKNPEILNEIFNNVEPVRDTCFVECERLLKNEYFKLYNEQLLMPEEITQGNKIGENIFELPTDKYGNVRQFNIIMTSIGAANTIFGLDNSIEDYYESWNRPCIGAQHISGSYIRRDMIATAPISNICYGFCEMSNDALVLAGPQDIASSWSIQSYARHSKSERYYSPELQINNSLGYNEMDIRRFQNGQGKQPDYIIIFKKDGKINNMEESKKASEQFKQHTGKALPVLFIDEERCLETEKYLLEQMIENYRNNPSSEQAKLILQKINNNRKTNGQFAEDIDLEEFERVKKDEKNKAVTLQDVKECFDEVKPEERAKFIRNFRQLYRQMSNIIEREGDSNEQR